MEMTSNSPTQCIAMSVPSTYFGTRSLQHYPSKLALHLNPLCQWQRGQVELVKSLTCTWYFLNFYRVFPHILKLLSRSVHFGEVALRQKIEHCMKSDHFNLEPAQTKNAPSLLMIIFFHHSLKHPQSAMCNKKAKSERKKVNSQIA